MESVKVIVVGFGDRGAAYTKYALDNPDRLKVIAVVDPNPFRRELAKEKFALEEDMLFSCVEDCVRRGKFADAVINTTMDELHIKTALPFLNLGYDMLLEKPITNNKKELALLKKAADEKNCRLMICHVLRYTPFYLRIKELLLSGEIGELVAVETNEMVGVAHASASYIRGKWNNREKCGSSMLLAKCCHDWDILLLDVEMPGMSGIDLAKRLRGAGCRAEIIFITSHFECMAEGYEVDALHYLVKPVPAEKLRAVLDRAAARLAVEPPSVVIACEKGNVKLYESELLYAESFLHDLVLHTTGPDYRIRESISAFAGRLSADFFRTHRSYLVNLKAVVRIGRTSVLLRGGAEVPLARGKYDAINRAFIDRN